jgi:hypothetical protein
MEVRNINAHPQQVNPVTSRIMVIGTRVKRHGTCKVHRYKCMCKMVASLYAAIETQEEYFVQY